MQAAKKFAIGSQTERVVYTSDPGDRDSIPGQVISNTKKMVLDATLLSNIR